MAAAVPADAKTIAFLHDVLERTAINIDDLRCQGLTSTELAAVQLLTAIGRERYDDAMDCLRPSNARRGSQRPE